jgi:hypothetical protein
MRLFLIAVALLACIGCREPVTWSRELRSPDEKWIATAKTVEHSGFGTGGAETTVEIKRSDGSASPERVLAFADAGSDIALDMHWDGPSHFVVIYKANPVVLYFQVVKTSGVDISVQDISPKPQQEFQPSARP